MITASALSSYTAILRFNSTLQCGRCLGRLCSHNARRWNVAVPAFVLVFSLVLAIGIYTSEGEK